MGYSLIFNQVMGLGAGGGGGGSLMYPDPLPKKQLRKGSEDFPIMDLFCRGYSAAVS